MERSFKEEVAKLKREVKDRDDQLAARTTERDTTQANLDQRRALQFVNPGEARFISGLDFHDGSGTQTYNGLLLTFQRRSANGLSVGTNYTISKCQGHPTGQLPNIGTGPLEDELARSLPENATLLGRVPRDELYARMTTAHCLLMPSVREGWGMVVIEANSVGTPAVGYDVGGIIHTVSNGTWSETTSDVARSWSSDMLS